MMFQGSYSTDFYREIRDLLHEEVNARMGLGAPSRDVDALWNALERRELMHRSTEPRPMNRAVG